MNQGIHAVDLLQWLAGAPHTVSALVRTRSHAIEAEDTVAAHLEFPNGAVGVIEAATSCYPGTPLRIEISGDRGTAILEADKLVKWDFAEKLPEDARAMEPAVSLGSGASDPKAISLEGHKLLIADLARAITTGTAPAISAREARHAVAIIEAIYASSRERRPVAVN
jgi:predicted dehydrogenase